MNTYLEPAITLLVGLIALHVYLKQKRDYKKDAANIVIIEIEAAERQLQIIKEGGSPRTLKENIFLMPSASWSTYRHLFTRDFNSREWDILSDFYNRCNQFDEAVMYNSTFFREDVEAYRLSINQVLAESALGIAKDIVSAKDHDDSMKKLEEADKKYIDLRDKILKLYMTPKNLYTYDPQKPINDAVAALDNLQGTILTSTIGVKLRKIAKQTFVQRLFSRNK